MKWHDCLAYARQINEDYRLNRKIGDIGGRFADRACAITFCDVAEKVVPGFNRDEFMRVALSYSKHE
jgi:hypothetical protein